MAPRTTDTTTHVHRDRKRLVLASAIGLAVLAAVFGLTLGFPLSKKTMKTNLERARELLGTHILIDGHSDFPLEIRRESQNKLATFNIGSDLRLVWGPDSQTDIPRLRMGRVGGQFWLAAMPCTTLKLDVVRLTLEQIDIIHRFVKKYSETFIFAPTADEIEAAFKIGKIGSLIGIDGGHSIDSSLAMLRLYYNEGVRYLTLTNNCDLPWADSWNGTGSLGGLSPFGENVVAEMNRLGMLVDLSHVSVETMKHALRVTRAPIIFSHSSAFALCNHLRNVPYDVLWLTKENGGLVMVNFYSYYISCSGNATLTQVADHIDHIKQVAGPDHVGIGAEYDFAEVHKMPFGLEDVSKYPDLFAELLARGWSEENLVKLAGGNLLRVLRRAEQVARDSANMEPIEDLIPQDLVTEYKCRLPEPVI